VNRNVPKSSDGRYRLSMAALTRRLAGARARLICRRPRVATASPPGLPTPASEAASKPSLLNPSYGTDARRPPKGSKKPFILDPLLGN